MNEDKANQILGNIQQLTEHLSVGTNSWIEERKRNVEAARQARNDAFWAALNPHLDKVRSAMTTSDTADAIEAIVKEIL